jgi:hypothetical protein
VHAQDFVVASCPGIDHGGVQRDVLGLAAAAVGQACPHQVHHHRPHHLGGIGQEVVPVRKHQRPAAIQAQEGLMHQRGRVQQRHLARLAQAAARQPAQVGVKQRIGLVGGEAVAAHGGLQQGGDLGHRERSGARCSGDAPARRPPGIDCIRP